MRREMRNAFSSSFFFADAAAVWNVKKWGFQIVGIFWREYIIILRKICRHLSENMPSIGKKYADDG